MGKTIARPVERVEAGDRRERLDSLVAEAPLELRLGETALAVLMRTPGEEAALGLGFAITEGMVVGPHEVEEVRPLPDPEGNRWELVLAEGVVVEPEQFQRNVYTTSSCGVCGKASIDAVRVTAPPVAAGPEVSAATIMGLPDAMRAQQAAFAETGGLHAAAAFTADGRLEAIAEDIGRHNAVDKAVGTIARRRWPIGDGILMVSGRISFEMVQKAAVAGFPILCGVSAASSLAVQLAEELGLTVVGFLRPNGFNLYAGAHRITG